MAVVMRSRRKPLSRSRSGDGLLKVGYRRTPKHKCSCWPIMTFFLALVVLVVVGTVQTTLRQTPGSIRKRQLRKEQQQQFYEAHNSDEQVHEEAYDGGRYQEEEEGQDDDGVLEEIEEAEAAIQKENRQQQEEEARIQREEAAELEAEEQIKQLQEEKARLLQQLKEEEERRKREEDLRRQKEEEERQKQLEQEEREKEEQLQKLQEEKQRLQEQLREEARRLKVEEEQEQAKQQEEAKLAAQRQAVKDFQPALHLERPKEEQQREALVPPEQPKIDFCDFMRKKPDMTTLTAGKDTGFSNPAVIILGVEDTSTDLMWHVVSQILYPGRKTASRTHELATKATSLDYSLLNKVGTDYQTEFWNHVSDKSHGKWMVHVFCQQQQHDIAAGFPWVTTSNKISDNQKAQETLELIKELPKGSLKILRIKRNYLDVAIRMAQRDQQVGKGQPVQLDRKQIFRQLRKIQAEQDAIDDYLQQHNVPHLTLDFDEVFPFNQWTDLVVATQNFQQSPAHINVDWGQLSTQLEATWRDVLRYIDVFTPLSMYDILHFAMQTHEAHSFWTQPDAVLKFPYIQQALQGTHYQNMLKKPHPPIHFPQWGEGDEM